MLALVMSAELDGVTDLRPDDSESKPFYYTFKVQCTSCRETHPNPVTISRFEENEQSGSRGTANFVWRCKNCKREHSATIAAAPTPIAASVPASKPATLLTLDCRGLEFVSFVPDGDWVCRGAESGTPFAEVDLSQGEWFDYDEKEGAEVSVKEVMFEIRRA
ncbi:hypothetical protein BDY21DRAFT_383899 [Lineolata rhizophorae]|uniref:DUF866-domain-containing protein n=1 Tax=Lineolata rhizophorae TaxID=578093 RepID=A0A6A6PB38_9PEZI|nr:hypothetical protein BDY21DRAFT_383899 [Lineolata rhizophorae]